MLISGINMIHRMRNLAQMFTATDYMLMTQALRLAERGLYTTTPNPRVGCVIVRDGRVIGSGWHEKAGQPHAEITH